MLRLPGLLQPEPLSPQQATTDPCLHRRHSLKADLAQSLWGLWGLVHTRFCCALQESCFPVGSQPFGWIPSLGNLLWALELLQQCENFFGVIVLQFVGHLLCGSKVGLMVTSSKRT